MTIPVLRSGKTIAVILALLWCGAGFQPALRGAGAQAGSLRHTNVDSGISIDLSIEPTLLREGDTARVTVSLKNGDTPLGGVFPNAWFARRRGSEPPDRKQCTAAVAAFLGGSALNQPPLDLNVYYVVAMNSDGTITVVDPHFSFGGTQLIGMLQLESPGYDWTLGANDTRLFVTMPAVNKVAVIDTAVWKLLKTIDTGPEPRRIVEQPDGHYLWITNRDGAVALRASELTIAATIPTGKGAHDVAVTDDNRTVVVTNSDDGTASLIDVATLKVVANGPAGAKPVSVSISPLSKFAYVSAAGGAIHVIDPKRRKAIARIDTEPGLERLRFAPGGRYGFTTNPSKNVVHIVDAATNRVVQTATIDAAPFEVTFSDSLAYIRSLHSEQVLMVPLANIGAEGKQVAAVDFPGGDLPFGKMPRATAADGIVPAPGENAVLVANPGDHAVYFYKEGMAAPIGHFSNYDHAPQAVLVLDRSLRETKPGTFTTTATLPPAGMYDVALFIDSPRVVTCFEVSIAENPAIPNKRMPVIIEHLTPKRLIEVGKATQLDIRLTDSRTFEPKSQLTDARALIVEASHGWSERKALVPLGDGRYRTELVPPEAGVYYVYVECPSIGLRASNPGFLVLQAQ